MRFSSRRLDGGLMDFGRPASAENPATRIDYGTSWSVAAFRLKAALKAQSSQGRTDQRGPGNNKQGLSDAGA
jgi:hypothetical protein